MAKEEGHTHTSLKWLSVVDKSQFLTASSFTPVREALLIVSIAKIMLGQK